MCARLRGLDESGSNWPSGTLRLECRSGRAAGGARRVERSEGAVCERDDEERWRGAIGMSRARGRVRCEGAPQGSITTERGRRVGVCGLWARGCPLWSLVAGRRTLSEALVYQQTEVAAVLESSVLLVRSRTADRLRSGYEGTRAA